MVNNSKINLPAVLNMHNFVASGDKYEDNYIKGAIKGTAYLKDSPSELYMVKHMDNEHLIADYLGSYFAHYLINERAPIVHLVTGEDNSVYTASKYIPNFYGTSDYVIRSNKCLSEGCLIEEDRKIHKTNDNKYIPSDKEEVLAAAEFVSYPDPNGRNDGVMFSDSGTNYAVIDFDLSMTEVGLRKPLELVYFQNTNRPKLIEALKFVTSKISKEFIGESIDKLFEQISKVIKLEDIDAQKTQATTNLINRLGIYEADIALLEIQEIIESNPINQNELLDSKLEQLDSITLTSTPGRILLNTAGMTCNKHPAIFEKLDGHLKSYSQDDFMDMLYRTSHCIKVYYSETVQEREIFSNMLLYISSEKGVSTIGELLLSLLSNDKGPDLTHTILAHLENSPEVLFETIEDMLYWWYGDEKAFNAAFPYIARNDEYREKIIDEAIEKNKIYDAIIPYLSYKDQCSAETILQPEQCLIGQDNGYEAIL